MNRVGFEKKNPAIYQMVMELDTEEHRDGMTFEQFLEGLTNPQEDRKSRVGINKIFDQFVEGKSETIGLEQLEAVAKELGETFTRAELSALLKAAGSNEKTITRDDFYPIHTQTSFD